MAAYTQDDGFHEIQLNGKQLVFLFMAATVVSVVIFLCGVLVGRGVRAERGDLAETEDLAPAAAADVAKMSAPPLADAAAPPPPAVDELSYFSRLEKPTPPVETLARPEAGRGSAAPAPIAVLPEPLPRVESRPSTAAPAASVPAPPPAKDEAPAAAGGTKASSYTVQVAALNVSSEADAMAKRLASKGYAAYVLNPANGTPAVFRVRIGTFKTRREAESTAARLQKEEQIKPWVVTR